MDLANFTILYVENVRRSVDFYRPLLECEPVEMNEVFALFACESGAKFGLWAKHDVLPTMAETKAGAMEMAFTVSNPITLQIIFIKWRELELNIIQELTQMDCGTSFVALDPDGHRLRVLCYAKA